VSVRWKLVAILIVPLAALASVSIAGIRQRSDDRAVAARASELVALGGAVGPAVHELQRETALSAWFVASGGTAAADELAGQRSATDRALEGLHAALEGFDATTSGEELQQALRPVQSGLQGVAVNRTTVDRLGPDAAGAVAVFDQQTGQLLDIAAQLARDVADPDLAADLTAWVSLGRAGQALSRQQVVVTEALARGAHDDTTLAALREQGVLHQAHRGVFLSLAGDGEKDAYRQATESLEARTADGIRSTLLATPAGTRLSFTPAEWMAASTTELDLLAGVEGALVQGVAVTAANWEAAAADDVRSATVLSAAVAAFALLTAALVGRSITRPLRRLVLAARDVADEQLPALVETLRDPKAGEAVADLTPVARTSRDEIGDVAEAVGDIQRVAVEVAHEQSALLRKGIGDLFVNLARRNQSLLDRQIAFLDELEANETDPEDLEHLFKLDHLATRMRRNAESLLVLAGVETPRRWGRPVPLGDVVRAAIAEVEDYGRIQVRALDGVRLQGGAAADVAHLCSELLDNAAQYSPPGTPVVVEGRAADEDGTGGYVLRVTDEGIGMSAAQLAEANATLADPPLTGLTLSRSLGFVVVSRLADRHGITVALAEAPDGGTTATVVLPASLLVADDGAESEPDGVAIGPGAGPRVAPKGWSRPADVPAAVWERITEQPTAPWPGPERAPATTGAAPASLADALGPVPDAVPDALQDLGPASPSDQAARPAAASPAHPASFGSPTSPAHLASSAVPPPRQPQAQPPDTTPSGLPRRRAADHAPPAPSVPPTMPATGSPVAHRRPPSATGRPPAPSAPGGRPSRPARPPAVAPGGLPRRVAARRDPAGGTAGSPGPVGLAGRGATASARSPEEIRAMLSSYRNGVDRARHTPAPTPADPADPEQEA